MNWFIQNNEDTTIKIVEIEVKEDTKQKKLIKKYLLFDTLTKKRKKEKEKRKSI